MFDVISSQLYYFVDKNSRSIIETVTFNFGLTVRYKVIKLKNNTPYIIFTAEIISSI